MKFELLEATPSSLLLRIDGVEIPIGRMSKLLHVINKTTMVTVEVTVIHLGDGNSMGMDRAHKLLPH